jgi:hypothetical protein
MPKHTPTPWKLRRDDDETLTLLGEYQGTTIKIATIYNSNDDECDARLIQSAPDLLNELKRCLMIMDGRLLDTDQQIERTRTLIDKLK